MRLRLLAFAGLLLGLLLVAFSTFTAHATALQGFRDADRLARQQDKSVASNSAQPCANPRLRLDVPSRVLLEGEAETATIRVTNTDTAECDITVSLVAPAFALQPTDNQRLVQLAPGASAELRWGVRATTGGTETLAVTTGNTSEQVGVSVVGGNGFVPPQRATLNYVGILFGTLIAVASLLFWLVRLSRAGGVQASPTPAAPTSTTPAPAAES
jgi:hypothetical protein